MRQNPRKDHDCAGKSTSKIPLFANAVISSVTMTNLASTMHEARINPYVKPEVACARPTEANAPEYNAHTFKDDLQSCHIEEVFSDSEDHDSSKLNSSPCDPVCTCCKTHADTLTSSITEQSTTKKVVKARKSKGVNHMLSHIALDVFCHAIAHVLIHAVVGTMSKRKRHTEGHCCSEYEEEGFPYENESVKEK